ncbi:MAG: hypothetical protein K1000chlam2_01091 [Chlamydiae bacterium]|nr:hypothetical protein [Chlamydiota bacterium]
MRKTTYLNILIGIAIFCVGFYLCRFQEINLDDETWFLQVVNRFLSGDVLYRDIFLGVTPLSVYITSFFCWLFGVELLVARGVLVLYYVCTILLTRAILQELEIPQRYSLLLILAFFVFMHPQHTWAFSGYNSLACVFFLACFLMMLKWTNRKSLSSLIFAGVFAGLCFGSKQNLGLIALFGVLASFFVSRRNKKEAFAILLPFLLVGIGILLPIFLQGGFDGFLEYAWLNKKKYLTSEHCNYFLIPPHWDSYSALIFAAPFLCTGIIFLALLRSQKRNSIILAIFLICSFLGLYPRPDNVQKLTCIPLILITILYGYNQIQSALRLQVRDFLHTTMIIWLFLGMGMRIYAKKEHLILCNLPHFKGVFITHEAHDHWWSVKDSLAKMEIDKNCFFLSTHGGFYYLLFELKNPTLFDYPIYPTLGLHGEDKVIDQIKTGEIHYVFTDHPSWTNWLEQKKDRRPLQLETYLKQEMAAEDLGTIFQIYQTADSANLQKKLLQKSRVELEYTPSKKRILRVT